MAVEKEKIGPASMPQINRFVKGAAIFKMAMIATTIKSSVRVKAACLARCADFRTAPVVRAFPLSVKCAIILGSMVITIL